MSCALTGFLPCGFIVLPCSFSVLVLLLCCVVVSYLVLSCLDPSCVVLCVVLSFTVISLSCCIDVVSYHLRCLVLSLLSCLKQNTKTKHKHGKTRHDKTRQHKQGKTAQETRQINHKNKTNKCLYLEGVRTKTKQEDKNRKRNRKTKQEKPDKQKTVSVVLSFNLRRTVLPNHTSFWPSQLQLEMSQTNERTMREFINIGTLLS